MLSQIFSFLFGFNVRIFNNKVETECLVRCDDDLFIYTVRSQSNHKNGKASHLFHGARTSSSASSYHGVYVRWICYLI